MITILTLMIMDKIIILAINKLIIKEISIIQMTTKDFKKIQE